MLLEFLQCYEGKKYKQNSYIVNGEASSLSIIKSSLIVKKLKNFFFWTKSMFNTLLIKLIIWMTFHFQIGSIIQKKYPLKNNFLGFNSKVAIPITATRGCPPLCFNYCTYPLQQGRKLDLENCKKCC